jgi:ATP-binding cassette, subfamily C, bacterial CydD
VTRAPGTPAMRRHLVASVCCGVLIAAATLATAVLLARVIAGVVSDPRARTLGHWASELVLLVVIWTVRVVSQWAQARLSQRGATAAIADLQQRVLATVTARPPRRLAAERDDAVLLVTHGLDGLRPYYTRYVPALILAVLITPAAVLVMAFNDLQSAVIVLIALPLVPIFMILIGLVTRDRSAAALRAMTALHARTLDLVAGIPTLKALGRADGPAARITELGRAHRRSAMATLRIAFMSSFVLELLATLGVAMVAVSVGLRLVFGDLDLTTALVALLVAPEVFWPLRRVGAEFHAARDGRTAEENALGLIGDPDAAPVNPLSPGRAGVRLDGVSVEGGNGTAPHRLSLDIVPGAVTVLTGPNGSGKSTAIEVVLGLTAPSEGEVLVDGDAAADPRGLWPSVGWLPQRPVLVPGTVRTNLELLGPLSDLDSACRAAAFDEVIADLPDGLDTPLGRDGAGLSLGQRQRLALARVLGREASILLLDEPTAHLDDIAQAHVLHSITARARAGAAVLVIAHHDAVLDIADHLVRIGGDALVAK